MKKLYCVHRPPSGETFTALGSNWVYPTDAVRSFQDDAERLLTTNPHWVSVTIKNAGGYTIEYMMMDEEDFAAHRKKQ